MQSNTWMSLAPSLLTAEKKSSPLLKTGAGLFSSFSKSECTREILGSSYWITSLHTGTHTHTTTHQLILTSIDSSTEKVQDAINNINLIVGVCQEIGVFDAVRGLLTSWHHWVWWWCVCKPQPESSPSLCVSCCQCPGCLQKAALCTLYPLMETHSN